MGFNDQLIPEGDSVHPIPPEAFVDPTNPTDVEAQAWVNINVPLNEREGSLAGYNRPSDPVSTTTYIFLWRIIGNPSLKLIRMRDNLILGTKWYFGSAAPLAGTGKVGDFHLRTANWNVSLKTNLGWEVIGNLKGDAGTPGSDGDDGDDGTNGNDGREVEFNNNGTHIRWRYVGDASWINLVALTAITGATGPQGEVGPGLVISGALDDEGDLPVSPDPGTAYVIEGNLFVYDGSGWNDVGSILGPQGAPGDDGEDGREIEVQNNGTHVQWRYVGAGGWTNLIALTAITGPAGAAGSPGAPGDDGREVEFNNNGTNIRWRYVGEVSWTTLVALVDITGPAGAPGADGEDGIDGVNGTNGLPLAIQTASGSLNWASYNIFETASGVTAVTLPGLNASPNGSLCMIVNARTSGNITINLSAYTLIGHAAKAALAPNEGICFIKISSTVVGIFSEY